MAIETTAAGLAAQRATENEIASKLGLYERMKQTISDPAAYAAIERAIRDIGMSFPVRQPRAGAAPWSTAR